MSNNEKFNIRRRFLNYENSNNISRPTICPVCKKEPKYIGIKNIKRLMQAHHDDYSKPFEVKYMCFKCHSDLHKTLNNSKIDRGLTPFESLYNIFWRVYMIGRRMEVHRGKGIYLHASQ